MKVYIYDCGATVVTDRDPQQVLAEFRRKTRDQTGFKPPLTLWGNPVMYDIPEATQERVTIAPGVR